MTATHSPTALTRRTSDTPAGRRDRRSVSVVSSSQVRQEEDQWIRPIGCQRKSPDELVLSGRYRLKEAAAIDARLLRR